MTLTIPQGVLFDLSLCLWYENIEMFNLFQNVELVKDARSARTLRDELDILREKVGFNNLN